jgi:hypothetical protein
MKSKLLTLILSCMTFLPFHFAHAGLLGKELNISYDASTNSESGPTGAFDYTTLIVQEPFSSAFGIVVDNSTIKFAPTDYFGSLDGLDSFSYSVLATDGSLSELDWTTLATTFPNFNADDRIIKYEDGFSLFLTGLPLNNNYVLSISTFNVPVAVPEPSMIGLMLIGLLAFLGYRRQTGPSIHRHSSA